MSGRKNRILVSHGSHFKYIISRLFSHHCLILSWYGPNSLQAAPDMFLLIQIYRLVSCCCFPTVLWSKIPIHSASTNNCLTFLEYSGGHSFLMVVYTGFKATLKRVPRELYAMLLYIMIEFRSVPLSLRHEHQKPLPTNLLFTSKSSLIKSRPVRYRHQILTKVVVIVIFPIDVHGHAINVCLCYRNVYDSMTVTVSNINLDFGFWLTSFRPGLGVK